MQLSDFDYILPEELIAQVPIEPRDLSRLMLIDKAKGEIFNYQFRNIDELLKAGDVLVLNKTKVIPARLFGRKEATGTQLEVLLLNRLEKDLWEVILRPGKRLKVGQVIIFGESLLEGELISTQENGNRVLKFKYDNCILLLLFGLLIIRNYLTSLFYSSNLEYLHRHNLVSPYCKRPIETSRHHDPIPSH